MRAPPEGTDAPELEEIEAKPRKAGEAKLKDALFTVESYLANKRRVLVYEWPTSPRRTCCLSEDEEDWDEDWDEI